MKLTTPEEVAVETLRLMSGFGAPWCVAGGWALDLVLGRVTRAHSDVELAVLRRDQSRLHTQFDRWMFTVSVPDDQRGHGRAEWRQGEELQLPMHEIHASSPDDTPTSIEFLLSEASGEDWVFRRDPSITQPLDLAFVDTEFGVRALSPEIALLFKSKSPRPKDEADFLAMVGVLSDSRRQWLTVALQRSAPHHPWLAPLNSLT